ncbi:DUF6090 family protein [Winogradskyella schleiferi]|uniref:DUF6090 family protein n=1 Tax=Winogradskyella schleiferi TaxID=2686078 RepID=UPI0015B7F9C1|nr:DUF6090 family protein [Winogradskyella schleiferi]
MKKKLIYAFGEILIVIVGISIAFSMNKCADNSKNAVQKKQYLANLEQDINEDKKQLETNLEQINEKIAISASLIPVLGSNDPQKQTKLRGVYTVARLTSFTPKDFTYQALVNSGDLKLIDNFELKKAIEKHYAKYKAIAKAYERQETINKDYLGNYFIYNTDYDLIREGKSPFKDEKLLKNIMQSIRGSFIIKKEATELGIKSCDSILEVLE